MSSDCKTVPEVASNKTRFESSLHDTTCLIAYMCGGHIHEWMQTNKQAISIS